MHPVLLGTLAALSWGTLDFLAGLTSRSIGYAKTTAGVTIAGLVLLTIWLAVTGTFPPIATIDALVPLAAGVGFALATMWLFAALASGPISLAVPVAMSYPATTVVLYAAMGTLPSLLQLAAVVAIIAGIGLVAWAEPDATHQVGSPGQIRRTLTFAALAHVTFLVSVVAGQSAATAFGHVESVWISRIGGTLAVLPFIFAVRAPAAIPIRIYPMLSLMGALDVTALALLFAAGKTQRPELATVCAAGAGAITVILAASFLKEEVRPTRWVGIAIVFAGIASLSLVK